MTRPDSQADEGGFVGGAVLVLALVAVVLASSVLTVAFEPAAFDPRCTAAGDPCGGPRD